ncbi:hypothetical protein D3C87_175510 [compost metagenome]
MSLKALSLKKKTAMLLATLVVLASARGAFLLVERRMIENYESKHFCETYSTLGLIVLVSPKWRSLLASFRSQGICGVQDIEEAVKIYRSAFEDDDKKVGFWLFHDALNLAKKNAEDNINFDMAAVGKLFLNQKS